MVRHTTQPPSCPATSRKKAKKAKKKAPMSKLFHNGFSYTRAWGSRLKIVLRCSVYRSAECDARLEILPDASEYNCVNEHTCVRPARTSSDIVDCSAAMKDRTDRLSVEQLARPVNDIWKQVSEEFYPKDGVIRKGLSEEQVRSRIYRVRKKHYGVFLLGRVEVPPLSMVEGKNLSFFQFHQSRPTADPTSKPDRIIGWAHPELRQLLMYNGVSLFFDGTFRCVPSEFKQCMVMMVHDQATELFVPVYFVLCNSKARDMYFDILELIYRDTSEKLEPCDVVCDFELPLMNAIEKQFPNAEIIGCLFHFKQAVRRRMKGTYSIPEAEVRIAMEKGVLDMLTVIDPESVPRQGIRWVKRTIRERCDLDGIEYSRGRWKQFWGYFRATWFERYNIESWNIYGLSNELVARTNNPLERFHRELNRAFPTPHPNMVTFVTVIRAISQDFVVKLANISQGRRKRGNKRNANKRKGSRRRGVDPQVREQLDLPVPVSFTGADAADDSESEEEMVDDLESEDEIDYSSPDETIQEDTSDADIAPDFSFEPGEYCDDTCTAIV